MKTPQLTTLSTNHRKVLNAVQLDHSLSVSEIARRAGLRTHVVQYVLTQLKESGFISPYYIINPHILGLTDYCLFLNPLGYSRNLRDAVRKFLKDSPAVAYFAELSGEYQLTISSFADSIVPIDALLQDLQRAVSGVSWEVNFAIRLRWILLSRGYLGQGSRPDKIDRNSEVKVISIDQSGRNILQKMTLHPELPLSRVANLVGLSEAALRQRKARMMNEGLIVGQPYQLNTHLFGYTPYRALIRVTARNSKLDEKFIQFAAHNPNISEVVICFGAWDYEINFQVPDPESADEVISNLYEAFRSTIRSIKTMGELMIGKLHHFNPDLS